MTPDKCEHRLIPAEGAWAFCAYCGLRFVPSDVLEVALDALESVEWVWSDAVGDKTCSYCGSRAFHTGDGPHRQHVQNCKLATALARIGGVLGK